MKKLILWISIVAAVVILVDISLGYVSRRYLSTHSLPGDYESFDYVMRDSTTQLLVLGSSVALNSIDTKALSDSLEGVKAFNAGANGQKFPFYLSILEIAERNPSLNTVILTVAEYNLADTGVGSRYNFLVPYYKRGFDGIDRRLETMYPENKFFLKSSLFRYNTIWFRIFLYHFMSSGIKGQNGFVAKGIPAYFPSREMANRDLTPSAERKDELQQFVDIARRNGWRLIVCIPPRAEKRAGESGVERYLRQQADSGKFELWFDSGDTPISSDSTLFYDATHLNVNGAKIYTDSVIKYLRR